MKDVFEELETEVAQYAVDRKHDAIEQKNLLIANDNLIAECLSQEVFCVATNSELNVARFTGMHVANTTTETRCLALEAELANLHRIGNNPSTPDKHTPDFNSVFVIGKMQASLQGKDNVIRQLKKKLSQLQVTRSDTDRTLRVQTTDSQITKSTDHVTQLQAQNDLKATVNPQVSAQDKHAIDVEPVVPRLRNNMDAHLDYLMHLKHSHELLEYAIGTCPQGSQQRAKQLAHIPLIRKNQVTIAKPSDKSDSTTHRHVVTPKSHVKANRISPAKGDNNLPVDDQPRKNKSHLRTSNRIDSSSRLKRTVIHLHSDSICQTCNNCSTPFNHDLCVATCLQFAMATPSTRHNCDIERKIKQVWKPKPVGKVWKPTGKVLTTIGHQWRPTGWILQLGKQFPLTRFTPPKVVTAKQSKKRARTCANQMEPNYNWGSKVSNVPSLSDFKCRSFRSSFDKMADVNTPSGQTPTMAPPARADDQILPHIRWIPIRKSNCYLDLEISQSNPIYKITVDLLKNTNFLRAFTAS
nr:hypothetical protein [Tanacetum cinerariifolium]